jgi:isoleucyl-tRNA synthetase
VPGEKGVYRRVPEVIDCWFDSGCMPFAQHGYPHVNQEAFEKEFPADFITEAIDQTRGWFYSLLTISTLLFPERPMPHPFKHCTVLGLLTDEKGFKLSKSRKNYKDPMYMFDEYGGDAVRWALFTSAVPGQSGKWFEGGASDAIRELLLKVWNCYSFFVTYANIDGWSADSVRPPISERAELDRWILAELDETVRYVGESLEHYETHPASRRIETFVDALSNWYVRRSRGRFWGSDKESTDKKAAFATLYEVLVDLARLLAPFTPFLADTVYRNLTKGVAGAASSVHLTTYPTPDDARQDDDVRRDMALVRDVVGLGNRVRAAQKLKVRQPLGSVIVVTTDTHAEHVLGEHRAIIEEELNVEKLVFTHEPQKYVQFQVVPNFRALGPKIGKDVPAVKAALGKADGGVLYDELGSVGKVTIQLPDRAIELGPDEIEIRLNAKEGFAAASDRGTLVVLDTTITPALKHKGWAREAVSKIQAVRKQLELAFEARIAIGYEADAELAAALTAHHDYVAGEVLAASLTAGLGAGERTETDVDGQKLVFTVAAV